MVRTGKGDPLPLVNVLWESLNLFISVLLFAPCPFIIGFNLDFVVLCAGFLAIGVYLAFHFGKVRRGNNSSPDFDQPDGMDGRSPSSGKSEGRRGFP